MGTPINVYAILNATIKKTYISTPSELVVLAGGHAAYVVRVPHWNRIFWQLLQSVLVHVVAGCGEDNRLVVSGGGNDVGNFWGVQTQLLEFVELVVLHDVSNSAVSIKWWKLGSSYLTLKFCKMNFSYKAINL